MIFSQVPGSEAWAVGLVVALCGFFGIVVAFLRSNNTRVDTTTADRINDIKEDKNRLLEEKAELQKQLMRAEASEENTERELERCRGDNKSLIEENILLKIENATLKKSL